MSKYFLFVGNAYPHKNLSRLVEAIVYLNKVLDEPARLKIVSGRGVFTQRLESLLEKMQAKKYVEMLGFVKDKDLKKLYANSLAFVFPSLSEGFGIPGIEAMKFGTLLLASDIPVFREVYKDHAIYFNPLDFSAIGNAMRNALQMSDEERRDWIQKSQKFVKRYSWRKMAKETLKVYYES